MIRYHATDIKVADFRVAPGDDEVQRVSGAVGRASDVLYVAERLEQLLYTVQTNGFLQGTKKVLQRQRFSEPYKGFVLNLLGRVLYKTI